MVLQSGPGFFLSEAWVFILFFFFGKGVAGFASSSNYAELPVSSVDSSPSSNSGKGSFFFFFFFTLLFWKDGSELEVFESLLVFFAFLAAGIEVGSSTAGGILTLAISATKSLTCFYRSGVFTSPRDFCSVSFGSGGWCLT